MTSPNQLIQTETATVSDVEALYPLSPMQRGMLFHTLLEPQTGVYINQLVVELEGAIDPVALRRAWQRIIDRHGVLRTCFTWKETAEPLQLVERCAELPWDEQNWREMGKEEQKRRLDQYLEEDRIRGFDLEYAPLMRVLLAHTSERRCQLVWSHHHLLLDGWSVPLVMANVFRFYEGECSGEWVQVPSPRPYADYIGWLQKQDLSRAEGFWREVLRGFTSPSHLRNVIRSDSAQGGARRAHQVSMLLDERTTKKLRESAQQNRTTFNTLLSCAWGILLSIYSGKKDVVFGAATAGRPPELASVGEMVGMFINTLPVRLIAESTMLECLQALQRQQTSARIHEYCSLVDIQKWSDVPAGVPLFDNVFVFQNYPIGMGKWARSSRVRVCQSKIEDINNYPITAIAIPGEQLELQIAYDITVSERADAERLLKHWKRVVEEMVEDPGKRISSLEIMDESERSQVVVEWNGKEEFVPLEVCIHELFEEQVRRDGERTALVCESRNLSYAELNGQANRVADYLREAGVRHEVRVGLYMERGVEMMVGMLGILKAGGAYIALDPKYPLERVGYMLEDAQAPVVLTQEHLEERLPASWAQVICIDRDWLHMEKRSGEDTGGRVKGANAAYVIYTSGSTGRPKGVVITHEGLVNLALAQIREFEITEQSRILQFASISFDASVSEWATALCSGASLVLPGREEVLAGDELLRVMKEREISVITLPPSVLATLPPGEMEHLRTLVVAGEACGADLAGRWANQCRMLNAYGPTEITVCATVSGALKRAEKPDIGHPISNMQMYVLDEDMKLTPTGVTGELYIGGAGLARGYLNRPEMTAERFVPNPFTKRAGERLYRSGDLGRWRDGVLEFLGRMDNQVKVRGYRIEPGEIEAAIQELSWIIDAAVITQEDQSGQKRLVAYVVTKEQPVMPDASDLREQLQHRLPDYMVPSAYFVLKQLPLTPNGKVDRQGLAKITAEELGRQQTYVAPRNEVEEILCAIWSRVLGVEKISTEDNFFAIGGQSLIATQLVSQIHQIFGIELGLKRIFEKPTVAGLAAELEPIMRSGAIAPASPIVRAERGGVVAMSYAQQRMWFMEQMDGVKGLYNLRAGVRMRGKLEVEVLGRVVREVVRRHEVLRTRFGMKEGKGVQIIEGEGKVELEVVELKGGSREEKEEELRREMKEEGERGFDVEQGPLLRAKLWKVGEEEHGLLLTMHHLVSDGWSMGVLLREVSSLYEDLEQGRESRLGELRIQYADYAVWQREWLQGERLEEQLRYWRKQLEGLGVVEMGTDHVRPGKASNRGGKVRIEVGKELVGRVKEVCRGEGVTLFMGVVAGVQMMMWRYSGGEDVGVGTVIANRRRAEVEGLIGFFANTLVLRTRLGGNPGVKEVLRRVREVSLGAYGHQDLPFEKLVEEMEPGRDLSRNPLFQVMVVLQNVPKGEMKLGGVKMEGMGVGEVGARFDLDWTLEENEAGGLSGELVYARDLWEEETVERMVRHWVRGMEGMVKEEEKGLWEMEWMEEEERRQVVEEWNGRERGGEEREGEGERERSVQERIEEQVRRRGRETAVEWRGERMSYQELNERANRLAHCLRGEGVRAEERVGLCVERGPEMVVGILGIIKAGGVYVPLDPEYPEERLRYMVRDGEMRMVVTEEKQRGRWGERGEGGERMVVVDGEERKRIGEQSGENPEVETGGENAVYVIYTSGSSGQPKGVVVSHGNVSNFLSAMDELMGESEPGAWLAVTSMCFDISVVELLWTLTHGDRIVLHPGLRVGKAGEVD